MTLDKKNITLNGAPAQYLDAGEANGKALLLLHGLGSASLAWGAAIPTLAENYRIIAPDLPGFGGSAPLPDLRLPALLGWLKALLDSQNIQQAVVVGNSIGGLVGRLFAAGEPQYVPALVLVNGGGVPTMPSLIRSLANAPVVGEFLFGLFGWMAASQGEINKMIHVGSVKTPDFIQQVSASGKGVAAMTRMLARDPLPQATTPLVPTLLLWGAEDQLAPLSEAEKIKSSIPGSILSPIANCGHMPQLEATDVFTWQVHQFLENLSRPSKPASRGAGLLGQRP